MKKTLILTALIALFFVAQAQVPVDEDTKLITYQEVVEMDGIKDTLYNRATKWVNRHYKNPQSVLITRDVNGGKLVGKHRIRMVDTDADGNVLNSNTLVNYKFTIECKDGRFRYTFDSFTMKAVSRFPLERWLDKEDPMYTPKWEEYLAQVDREIREIIEELKEAMKPVIVKDDDW
ncbi:MAG: hypothetical protein C0592_07410 [Marinilabiliales bacterium]|nr:MAG: hypothetical protein C0592_07410 [Marinilabiliales bacterium]